MATESGLTLTRTAYFGRLTIKYGLIAIVILMVGRTFLGAAISYWVATHPPAPPPPTVGFGVLPTINFPVETAAQKPTSYQLQTANGSLPTFSDRAKVFFMPRSSPSLLADQRAKQAASAYGFSGAPTLLSNRIYRWTKTTPFQTTFDFDIQNMTFSFTTNYLSHPELLLQKNLPADQQAQDLVKQFISSGQSLPNDLATPSAQITYLKVQGSDVGPAVSFSDADFIQVDVMRAPADSTTPFYTSDGTGIMHGIISGSSDSNSAITNLLYRYHPVDYATFQTYPLRTAAQAWSVLQAGEGYIAKKGQFDSAVVRSVSLGYYDDFNEQDYMQPIYVFTGDGGFLGYVPAIDSRYIQNTNAK